MDTKNKKYVFLINQKINLPTKDKYHVWHPATDLFETDNKYIVKVEISGMEDEGFSINFDKTILSIFGTRVGEDIAGCYHRMEIPYGEFSTSINIPGEVHINSIEAFYKNGILTVILPKEKPVCVEIKED
jgi:HSP20 family protein